jgi:pescadillo protein
MGNRTKGKIKKKSIKAAAHSGMGSKRKLSRMGKNLKKNNAGLEATFITRSQTLKRLKITLKDFRRLCILKGVYPREPRGRTPGNKKGQVFYHIKDVKALAHEPLLAKFREFRTFMKKVRKAAGRNEKDEAARKDSFAPTYTLHHLVRERYPRFVDALGDLDDALALTYLFAALPSTGRVSAKITKKAQSLAAQWGAYCSTTSAITKSFVSVKGVYMEATIQNTKVCWVIPHSYTQNVPSDVDFRVMGTFFEFYETLLGFVLYKLYTDIGVRYPLPVTSVELSGSTSILSANLHVLKKVLQQAGNSASNAINEAVEKQATQSEKKESESSSKRDKLKTIDEALKQVDDSDDDDEEMDDDDEVDIAGPLKDALESMNEDTTIGANQEMTLDEDASKRKRLFAGLTIFVSREVPKGYLELVCLAYGGKVGWEGNDSPIGVKDPSITHHIVDRPKLPASYDDLPKSREFVQPQWLLDSANFSFLLPTSRYAVGAELPPHLSPWVNNEEEGYTPAYAEEIEHLKNGTVMPTSNADNEIAAKENEEDPIAASEDNDDSAEEAEESEEEEEEEDEKVLETKRAKRKQNEVRPNEWVQIFYVSSLHHKHLLISHCNYEIQDEEAKALAKTMMSKKGARLYGRMQHGLEKKQSAVELLHKRRKEIGVFKGKDKSDDGDTMLKTKVKRLKTERRAIEKDYEDTGGSMKKRRKSKK